MQPLFDYRLVGLCRRLPDKFIEKLGALETFQWLIDPLCELPIDDPLLELIDRHQGVSLFDRIPRAVDAVESSAPRQCFQGFFQRTVVSLDERFLLCRTGLAKDNGNPETR